MRTTLVALCLLAAASGGAGCDNKCDLRDEIAHRAGSGAVDCGHVLLGANGSDTDSCIITAFQAGKPFYARYERQGTDSHVVLGIARAADGTTTMFNYDGDPGGGGGDRHPVISGYVCENPSIASSPDTGPRSLPIVCGASSSLGYICK